MNTVLRNALITLLITLLITQKPPLAERLIKDIWGSWTGSLSNDGATANAKIFKIKEFRLDQSFHTLFTESLYILKLISLIITTVQLPLSQPFAFTSANGFLISLIGSMGFCSFILQGQTPASPASPCQKPAAGACARTGLRYRSQVC